MLHREQSFGARGVASRTRGPVAMGTPRRLGAGPASAAARRSGALGLFQEKAME